MRKLFILLFSLFIISCDKKIGTEFRSSEAIIISKKYKPSYTTFNPVIHRAGKITYTTMVPILHPSIYLTEVECNYKSYCFKHIFNSKYIYSNYNVGNKIIISWEEVCYQRNNGTKYFKLNSIQFKE